MPAIRVWRAASVQTGQSKANMAGTVGDQAEAVKSPLAHCLDSAGTAALRANVRLKQAEVASAPMAAEAGGRVETRRKSMVKTV